MTAERSADDAVIVLYGRASFDATQRLDAIAEKLRPRLGPGRRIAVAFTDLSGPSLPDVLEALSAEGCAEAVVVPCMVPTDPSLSVWLAGALSAWSRDRASPPVVRLAPAIEQVLDLADAVSTCLSQAAPAVTLMPPSLGKPGWSKIPDHGRQLFFCTGARCLHRGAEPLWQHLRVRMKAHRPLMVGPRRVMCARSSCLYPCNLGPLLTVHPDGIWYGRLDREALDRIVVEHLIGGEPVGEHVVHVTSGGTAPDETA